MVTCVHIVDCDENIRTPHGDPLRVWPKPGKKPLENVHRAIFVNDLCTLFLPSSRSTVSSEKYLQTAQKKIDQKMSRNNCRLLMQQSEAYLAAGQPDACVQQALKGLEIARILESTSNMYWASEILAKLRVSAFSRESVVDELQKAVRC